MITTIDSAERARDELAKIYGPGIPVFARRVSIGRFPFEVGYRTHDGHHVRHHVIGRGASWTNALDNAERRINRELHGKRDKKPARKFPLAQTDLFA